MKNLINQISTALQNNPQNFYQELENSDTLWQENYPIAVLHTIHRAKTEASKKQFAKLIDAEGISKEQYTEDEFQEIFSHSPEALQSVKYVALKNKIDYKVNYKAKNANDFWKKIKDVDALQSTFDFQEFSNNEDASKVEFALRELIRKRKEVHALKEVGFIWMAITDTDCNQVFKHYFEENYTHINNCYIGWSEQLKDINMRYFVYQPK